MDRYKSGQVAIVLWLAAVLIALTFALATAADCTLTWNHEGADGYRVYMNELRLGQEPAKVWEGTEKSALLQLNAGITYQFYVVAFKDGIESAPSDILQYTVPTQQQTIIVTGQPTELVIKFLQ